MTVRKESRLSTAQQKMVLDWTVARDDAEGLLRSLLDAKRESEKRLRSLHQSDPFKRATGRSAIDDAIASTQRMIETLNRNIRESRHLLEDLELEPAGDPRAR